MPKQTKKPHVDRVKIDVDWKEAARRMLNTPAKSTPKRATKSRKKT
jgi:hypothetical protein